MKMLSEKDPEVQLIKVRYCWWETGIFEKVVIYSEI